MKKVLAFGTFDRLHPGHEYFLSEAKKLGDYLVVVVALDETVQLVKNRSAKQNQTERLENVEKNHNVDKARLGNSGDKYKVIEEEKPDIIALGYDQHAFTDQLEIKFGKTLPIIRIDSFFPEKYKSSKMP